MENKMKNLPFIPQDILDDLASRFIINIPEEEKANMVRVCFQIELAHWFYLDFLCSHKEQKQDKKLPSCGMKQFTSIIFQHVPFLHPQVPNLDKILEDWKQYKLSVPTYGAILISENLKSVLLVQSYFAKSSWGFPKGKINENEDPMHCAIREVYEETGYDCSKGIKENDYIDLIINFQYTRLYLVTGVSLNTKFQPRTRNEIKCCEWFPVEFLPSNKYQVEAKANLGIGPNSFFMILPFIKPLKRWLKEFERRKKDENKPSTSKSTTNRRNRMQPNFDATPEAPPSIEKDRRPRPKSTSEEGFKLANFEIPQNVAVPNIYGSPAPPTVTQALPSGSKQEPRRRRLVFENKNFKHEEAPTTPITILQRQPEKTSTPITLKTVAEQPKKSFSEAFAEDAKKIMAREFKFDKQKIMDLWHRTMINTAKSGL
ncbi:m7GpppN-mRNA hydrolase [Culicoides brevitarsis]|uniref:m7GpppN-mRNA hydrolase n=1 Tax=Culicoides brevitarsis TaxID=469753 RepID=UPI00307B81D0